VVQRKRQSISSLTAHEEDNVAFSKTPDINTYSTKQIPLAHAYHSRQANNDKDVDYLNVYFDVVQSRDTQEQHIDIHCRPGVDVWTDFFGSTDVRAVYYWEEKLKYFVWVQDDIKVVSGANGSILTTISGVLGTSSGDVGVTEFLYDDGTVKLVFTDGVDLKTVDDAYTVVASASPDLRSPCLTTLVFLDGYLFMVDATNNDIVNSNLNDPLAFTAGDFIQAEMVADTMKGLFKINNYIVAFGKNSIEYFWDAANATGSPLQRNDTPVKFNGLLSINTVARMGNKLYFLGNNNEGSPTIFMMEDFKLKEIGNESMRRQLSSETSADSSWNAAIMSFNGLDFYVVSGAATKTYVVNLEKPELWTRWAFAGTDQMQVRFAVSARATGEGYTCVFYAHGTEYLFQFDPTITTDNLVPYTWTVVTPREDFDNYNQKVINRLSVKGDRPSADTTMSISWTDDDYQTFSTPQTVNLNQELPCIYQCGPFRRRAHKLTCTPTVPFRVRTLEVDVNLGNS
jgi:hypothetical protein